MAKESEGFGGTGLDALTTAIGRPGRALPPIHLWDPPFCGDIDIRIARDGTWFHEGSPIGRVPLVRLFASVMRREGERFVLVTPVEKLGIVVEDAPFLGVELRVGEAGGQQVIDLRTNLDEWVRIDAEHPFRFEPGEAGGLKPYALVRGALWALVTRALFYDLVDRGEVRTVDGIEIFGIASSGHFFPMAPAEAIGLDP